MFKVSKFLVVGAMGNWARKFCPKTGNSVLQAFLGPKMSRMSDNLSFFMK